MLELIEDHLILISRIYFSNKNYAFSQQCYNSVIYIIIYVTTKFIKFEAYVKCICIDYLFLQNAFTI